VHSHLSSERRATSPADVARSFIALLATAALLHAPTASAQQPVAPAPAVEAAHAPLRILWIGNSYSFYNDLPRTLTMMAMAAGENRVPAITAALVPGDFLRGHVLRGDVVRALEQQRWDYVVLQDNSLGPIQLPDSTVKYGTVLGALAKKAGATVLLYVTWPRQATPQTAPVLVATYSKLADAIGATLVPVGPAWMAMREESPSSVLYMEDGSHPTPIGSYVAASVFYRVLYNKPAVGLLPNTFKTTDNRYQRTVPPAVVPTYVVPATEAAAAHRAAERATRSTPQARRELH